MNPGSTLLTRGLGGAEFPEDLAEDAESEIGIGGGEAQAADEAADLFFGGAGRAPFLGTTGTRFQVAAGTEGVEQERSDTFEIGGRSGTMLLWLYEGLWISREFIEADGYGLTKIHGAMLFASGNA